MVKNQHSTVEGTDIESVSESEVCDIYDKLYKYSLKKYHQTVEDVIRKYSNVTDSCVIDLATLRVVSGKLKVTLGTAVKPSREQVRLISTLEQRVLKRRNVHGSSGTDGYQSESGTEELCTLEDDLDSKDDARISKVHRKIKKMQKLSDFKLPTDCTQNATIPKTDSKIKIPISQKRSDYRLPSSRPNKDRKVIFTSEDRELSCRKIKKKQHISDPKLPTDCKQNATRSKIKVPVIGSQELSDDQLPSSTADQKVIATSEGRESSSENYSFHCSSFHSCVVVLNQIALPVGVKHVRFDEQTSHGPFYDSKYSFLNRKCNDSELSSKCHFRNDVQKAKRLEKWTAAHRETTSTEVAVATSTFCGGGPHPATQKPEEGKTTEMSSEHKTGSECILNGNVQATNCSDPDLQISDYPTVTSDCVLLVHSKFTTNRQSTDHLDGSTLSKQECHASNLPSPHNKVRKWRILKEQNDFQARITDQKSTASLNQNDGIQGVENKRHTLRLNRSFVSHQDHSLDFKNQDDSNRGVENKHTSQLNRSTASNEYSPAFSTKLPNGSNSSSFWKQDDLSFVSQCSITASVNQDNLQTAVAKQDNHELKDGFRTVQLLCSRPPVSNCEQAILVDADASTSKNETRTIRLRSCTVLSQNQTQVFSKSHENGLSLRSSKKRDLGFASQCDTTTPSKRDDLQATLAKNGRRRWRLNSSGLTLPNQDFVPAFSKSHENGSSLRSSKKQGLVSVSKCDITALSKPEELQSNLAKPDNQESRMWRLNPSRPTLSNQDLIPAFNKSHENGLNFRSSKKQDLVSVSKCDITALSKPEDFQATLVKPDHQVANGRHTRTWRLNRSAVPYQDSSPSFSRKRKNEINSVVEKQDDAPISNQITNRFVKSGKDTEIPCDTISSIQDALFTNKVRAGCCNTSDVQSRTRGKSERDLLVTSPCAKRRWHTNLSPNLESSEKGEQNGSASVSISGFPIRNKSWKIVKKLPLCTSPTIQPTGKTKWVRMTKKY